MTEYGRKRMIDRIIAATTESELKTLAGSLSDSAKRDPEIYAAVLRTARALKQRRK